MNLKGAIKQGKIDQFIAQNKGVKGDRPVFDTTLSAMAGKSSRDQKASSRDARDD